MGTFIGPCGRDCVLIILFQFYGTKAELFVGILLWVGQYDPYPQPSYWKKSQSNINIQFLSNLFKIIPSQKTADISFFIASKGKKIQKIDKNNSN